MSSRRRPQVAPPPGNQWARWKSNSEDGRLLAYLIKTGEIANLTHHQVQETYPQFCKYNPVNFGKNISAVKKEVLISGSDDFEVAMHGIQMMNMAGQNTGGVAGTGAASAPTIAANNWMLGSQQPSMRANSPFNARPSPIMSNATANSHPCGYAAAAFAASANDVGLQTPRGHSAFTSPPSGGTRGVSSSLGHNSPYTTEVGCSGPVQTMNIPHFMEEWYDGSVGFLRISMQCWNLSGARHERFIAPDGNALINRVVLGAVWTDPAQAFQRFCEPNGVLHFPDGHVRYVACQMNVQNQRDEHGNIVYEEVIPFPFTTELRFQNYRGRDGIKNIQYGQIGQIHCHLEMIERGAGNRHAYSSRRSGSNFVPDSISVISGIGTNAGVDASSVALSVALASRRSTATSRAGGHCSVRVPYIRTDCTIQEEEDMSVDTSGTSFYSLETPSVAEGNRQHQQVRDRAHSILQRASGKAVPIPMSPVTKQYASKLNSPKRQKITDATITIKKTIKENRKKKRESFESSESSVVAAAAAGLVTLDGTNSTAATTQNDDDDDDEDYLDTKLPAAATGVNR